MIIITCNNGYKLNKYGTIQIQQFPTLILLGVIWRVIIQGFTFMIVLCHAVSDFSRHHPIGVLSRPAGVPWIMSQLPRRSLVGVSNVSMGLCYIIEVMYIYLIKVACTAL